LGESLQSAVADDFVKTFERVPGATLEGSGAEPGAEVRAAVQMEKPTGETFVYQQYTEADANGEFTFTLPYSTTGYDEFGPENGYTNTSVTATGPYEITTGVTDPTSPVTPSAARANVTEAQVVGVDEATATVELEPLLDQETLEESTSETNTTDTTDTTTETTTETNTTETTTETDTETNTTDATGSTTDTPTNDSTSNSSTTDSSDDSDSGYQLTPTEPPAASASITTPRLRRVG